MEEDIYVLIEENVFDKTNCNELNIWAFDVLEFANAKLKELKDNFESQNETDNMVVEDETDEGSTFYNYSAYEDGNYDKNHYTLTIYTRQLNYC